MPDENSHIKMFGYMEKRGKMTIRGRWKRKWCVLEGHLLLYYKSQTEYLKLSPCCGSLNVTLVRKIQPNVGCQIHITTHSQIIILRTQNKEKQEEWFHALVSVLPQINQEGILRYSDSLFPAASSHRKSEKRKKRTINSRNYYGYENENLEMKPYRGNDQLQRIENTNRQNGLNCTRNNNRESKITNSKIYTNENAEIIPSLRNTKIHRSLSDGNIEDTAIQNDFKRFKRSFSIDCIHSSYTRDQVHRVNSIRDDDNFKHSLLFERTKFTNLKYGELPTARNTEFSTASVSRRRKKAVVIRRHSFGFFKKLLCRRKSRLWRKDGRRLSVKSQDLTFFGNSPATAIAIATKDTKNLSTRTTCTAETPEENNNTECNNKIIATEEVFVSTTKTSESTKVEESVSWTMIQYNEVSSSEKAPKLPIKTRINSVRYSLYMDAQSYQSETTDSLSFHNPNSALDELMSQLTDLNKNPNFLYSSRPDEKVDIPDYDIPRPHFSVISEMSEKSDTGNSTLSLPDSKCDNLSFEIEPDSLEMPWLSDNKNINNYWPITEDHHCCLRNNAESDCDSFLDSLNTIKHLP